MADATAAIHQVDGDPKYVAVGVAAIAVVAGQGVTITTATGFLADAGDDAGVTPAGVVEPAGQGDDDLDNSGGAAGDIVVRVRTRGLAKFLANATPDQTWIGRAVYWEDNQTVDLVAATTNDVAAGIVREFETSPDAVIIELVGFGRANP